MKCPKCGKESDAKFCPECGTSIEVTDSTEVEEAAVRKRGIPKALLIILWIVALPVMAIITIAKSKKLTKKLKIILIIAVSVLTLIVAVVGVISEQQEMNQEYEAILVAIENKDYEAAQEQIDDFLSAYPDSEYVQELEKQKEDIDAEVEKIKAAKEAEEERAATAAKKEKTAEAANISVAALNNMYAACEKISINSEKISDISPVDDWANGKRCSFDYSGYNFTVYFNKDETVNSINSGTIKFYSEGKKVADLNDHLITSEEQTKLKKWSKEYVEAVLKSPSSAEFPGSFLDPYNGWQFTKNGNKYTVASYVDSQNSFGAMIRSEFVIEYTWSGETATVTNFVFDGEDII